MAVNKAINRLHDDPATIDRSMYVSAAATIKPYQSMVRLESGTYTLTLPDPSECPGARITFQPVSSFSGSVTITSTGGSGIFGFSDGTINASTDVKTYHSNGYQWETPVNVT